MIAEARAQRHVAAFVLRGADGAHERAHVSATLTSAERSAHLNALASAVVTFDVVGANRGRLKAARSREIVVQPSAPGASWSAETHDRVVSDFLKLAIEVWQVEKRRVHFTGFSQGGGMTYRMRCALADTLASVAPVSMRGAACPAGTKALDTLYIMGKDDVFVTAEEAAQTVSSLLMTHSLSKDVVISMGDRHTFTRYKNAMGMVFEHLDHSYTSFPLGGHCFPGGLDAPGLYGCDEPAPFKHGRVVLDFFKAHPKRD